MLLNLLFKHVSLLGFSIYSCTLAKTNKDFGGDQLKNILIRG